MRSPSRLLAAAAAAAALTTTLGSCGLQGANQYLPDVQPGSIEPVPSLEGVHVATGGKNFTEQLILGKILALSLTAAGMDVEDESNIPGSVAARQSILNGDTDVQFEYTGTAWLTYLDQTTTYSDPQEQYVAVRDLDAENGITWLPPSPMNDTYAFAMGPQAAQDLGITKLSQLADVPVDQRTFCVEAEFRSRADGFEPMLQAYDVPLGSPDGVPANQVGIYDTGVVYTETASSACSFGEVFTTDGRIEALDLTVLDDDRGFFPSYNASLEIRSDYLAEHPEVADVLQPVSDALENDEMIEMNRLVDVDGEQPADVARDWLASEGFITCDGCDDELGTQ